MTTVRGASGALAAILLVLAACDRDTPTGTTGAGDHEIDIVQSQLHVGIGQRGLLSVVDGSGHDMTSSVAWSVDHGATAEVEGGWVTGRTPGITYVRADYLGAEDSVLIVVPLESMLDDGMALLIGGSGDQPIGLTGVAFVHDRLGSEADQTSISAAPGSFDPDLPPGLDFAGGHTRFYLSLRGSPEVGSSSLESWQVFAAPGGGFGLRGSNGVAVWKDDPSNPDRAELYVSVGTFDLEIEEVLRPVLAGLPSGVLSGRVAFDAAGLVIDLGQGAPRVVGQIGTETVRIFAEFRLALRIFPIGTGTIGIEGGATPFALTSLGAPQAGRYRDGLLLDYSVVLPGTGGTVVANQVWIGTPREGGIPMESVDPGVIQSRSAYAAGRSWAWNASGTDADAVFRGDGPVNAFSSGGEVRVTRYLPAGEDIYGLIEGELEIPQVVHGAGGSVSVQTVRGTFIAPVLPHALAERSIVPPPELPTPELPRIDPSRPRIGDGNSRINGRVIEDDFVGVAGVEVRIEGPAGSGTAITNALGNFAFEGLTAGEYTVRLVVPATHRLARGQTEVVSGIVVENRSETRLDLGLADAEGNGSLRIFVVDQLRQISIDGVEIVVRPEDKDEVVATLVSGTERLGMAVVKLEPGRYRLEVRTPPGYALSPIQDDPIVVQITTGHQWFELVNLVER